MSVYETSKACNFDENDNACIFHTLPSYFIN